MVHTHSVSPSMLRIASVALSLKGDCLLKPLLNISTLHKGIKIKKKRVNLHYVFTTKLNLINKIKHLGNILPMNLLILVQSYLQMKKCFLQFCAYFNPEAGRSAHLGTAKCRECACSSDVTGKLPS